MVASTTPVAPAICPRAGPNEPASESPPIQRRIGSMWLTARGGPTWCTVARLEPRRGSVVGALPGRCVVAAEVLS